MKFELYKLSHILTKKINFIYLIYIIILLIEVNLSGLFNPKFNKVFLYDYLGFFSVSKGLSIHFYFNLSFYSIITYYFFYYDLKYFSFSIFSREKFRKWLILKILYSILIIFLLKFITYYLLLILSKNYISISFNFSEFIKDFILIGSIQILLINMLLCSNNLHKVIVAVTYLLSLKFLKFPYHVLITTALLVLYLFIIVDIKEALESYSKK